MSARCCIFSIGFAQCILAPPCSVLLPHACKDIVSGGWQHEDGIADPNAAATALAGSLLLQRRYARLRVLASGL